MHRLWLKSPQNRASPLPRLHTALLGGIGLLTLLRRRRH
jgi:hypothetical protein